MNLKTFVVYLLAFFVSLNLLVIVLLNAKLTYYKSQSNVPSEKQENLKIGVPIDQEPSKPFKEPVKDSIIDKFTLSRLDEKNKQTLINNFDLVRDSQSDVVQPVMQDKLLYLVTNNKLYSYNTDVHTTSEEYTPPENFKISRILKSDKQSEIFLINYEEKYDSMMGVYGSDQTIVKFNTKTKEVEEIGTVPGEIYSAVTEVVELSNGNHFAVTRGGDGCGGWATAYLIKNGEPTKFEKYGFGCAEEDRYLAFDPKGNYIYSYILDGVYNFDDGGVIDKIIRTNIFNNEQEVILEEIRLNEWHYQYSFDVSNDQLLQAGIDNRIVIYDINTGEKLYSMTLNKDLIKVDEEKPEIVFTNNLITITWRYSEKVSIINISDFNNMTVYEYGNGSYDAAFVLNNSIDGLPLYVGKIVYNYN